MLTRILHNSSRLCTFLDQLSIDMSKPQRQHILNMADALLVCEDQKTLSALQRQFIEAPDASNMADFLRISPWQADDVRVALRANQVTWATAHAEHTGAPKVIYINIDDSYPSGAGGLVPRSQREHQNQTPFQECLLLSGLYAAHRKDDHHRRLAPILATEDCPTYQSSSATGSTGSLSQQEPSRTQHAGSTPPVSAQGLVHLCAVRQLVRFRKADQICPSPRLACDLWSQVQPQAQWKTHRPTGLRPQAQAVHTRSLYRCGREQDDLLCTRHDRSSAKHSL